MEDNDPYNAARALMQLHGGAGAVQFTVNRAKERADADDHSGEHAWLQVLQAVMSLSQLSPQLLPRYNPGDALALHGPSSGDRGE